MTLTYLAQYLTIENVFYFVAAFVPIILLVLASIGNTKCPKCKKGNIGMLHSWSDKIIQCDDCGYSKKIND